MENSSWDVAPATNSGVVPSFLQPLGKPVPMVATADIGRVAAELLRETWSGHRVVELESAHRVTPNEIAATFSRLLGRTVKMEVVPRDRWESLFRSQGMKNPRRASGCSTASTKVGSSSQAAKPDRKREKWRWKPCCGLSSNAPASRDHRPEITAVVGSVCETPDAQVKETAHNPADRMA